MSKVTFNGQEKLIIVNDGVTNLSVQRDLYSEWKRWKKQGLNSKYLPAMRAVGGDPISDVKDLGATYFLINGWRIRPFEGDHRLNIQGNLFTDPAGDSIVTDTIGNWRIVIEMETSSLVDSTIQQLPEIEFSSFNGGVTVDAVNGVTGTEFPRGTPQQPVNNLTDALTICNNRGFNTIYVVGELELNTGLDYSKFSFIGRSYVNNRLLIMSAVNTTSAVFRDLSVTGELDGGNEFTNCVINDLVYVNGHIKNSGLLGYIYLSGNEDVVIDGCVAVNPYNPPVIDMGGSGQNLAMPNYSGLLTIQNLTGGNYVGIGLKAGQVKLDATTVTNGTVHVSGSGELVDMQGNSIDTGLWNGGVTIINEAMSKATISSAVGNKIGHEIEFAAFGGGVHLDPINGTDSSEYPYGTPLFPCKTAANSYAIRIARGFNKVYLYNDLVLTGIDDGILHRVDIIGVSGFRNIKLTIDNLLITESSATNLSVTGTFKSGSTVTAHNCDIEDVHNVVVDAYNSYIHSGTYYETELHKCVLEGDIKINGEGLRRFSGIDLVFEGDFTTIDMQNEPCTISLDVNSGYFKVLNAVEGSLVELNLRGGEVELDASCIGGEFYAEGHGVLYNNSTMTIKDNHLLALETIPTPIWNRDIVYHLDDGSTGRALSDAGSAGNPWSTPVEGNTQPGTFGEFVNKKLLTVGKWLGLR